MMNVVYALEAPPESYTKSLFLAGPSPRRRDDLDWRPDALAILERLEFDGVVFVPLPRDGHWADHYEDQVEWETRYLHMADSIVFWVPRDLQRLPGLTTNVEFGMWFDSGKVVLGYPPVAANMRYLDWHAQQEHVPVFRSLEETLQTAVQRLDWGSLRTGGEREVPIHIWKLPHFQNWYRAQKEAGNRLDGARVLFQFRVPPSTKAFTFAFILHVDVHIASEGRNKVNEFLFSRTDIATVVGYCPPTIRLTDIAYADFGNPNRAPYQGLVRDVLDTEIAIIREFRSPARTTDCFIREIPGGSSWKPGDDPFVTMTHELEEETGLGPKSGFTIDPKRLRKVGSRQLCGTLSTHQAHVFACALGHDEMAYLKQQQAENVAHGVLEDSERTYVEIHKLGDLIRADSNAVDWSMLGMILTALNQVTPA